MEGTGQPTRVLVVDDDESVLQLLATKLGRAGFAVEGAPTAASALATAAWFKPEVVVIGEGMARTTTSSSPSALGT